MPRGAKFLRPAAFANYNPKNLPFKVQNKFFAQCLFAETKSKINHVSSRVSRNKVQNNNSAQGEFGPPSSALRRGASLFKLNTFQARCLGGNNVIACRLGRRKRAYICVCSSHSPRTTGILCAMKWLIRPAPARSPRASLVGSATPHANARHVAVSPRHTHNRYLLCYEECRSSQFVA